MGKDRNSAAFADGYNCLIQICADAGNIPLAAPGQILVKSLLTGFYRLVLYKLSGKMRAAKHGARKICGHFFQGKGNAVRINLFYNLDPCYV